VNTGSIGGFAPSFSLPWVCDPSVLEPPSRSALFWFWPSANPWVRVVGIATEIGLKIEVEGCNSIGQNADLRGHDTSNGNSSNRIYSQTSTC